MTYRRTNVGLADASREVKYEAAADSREAFDRGLLLRYALYWDAHARLRLESVLDAQASSGDSDDYSPISPELAEKAFVYDFASSLPEDAKAVITETLHRFLVLGVVYNWFRDAGLECEVTKEELEEMLDDICGRLRTGFVRTPLQPFDPKF